MKNLIAAACITALCAAFWEAVHFVRDGAVHRAFIFASLAMLAALWIGLRHMHQMREKAP